jgi:hypothetical protein
VLVGNFHNANAARCAPRRHNFAILQSGPTDTVDVDTCQRNNSMLRVSKQRQEGVSDHDNNVHQVECERHNDPPPAPAETHIAQYVATSTVARIEDDQMRAAAHDRPHGASCHRALNEGDFDCTSSQNTSTPGGTPPCKVARQ